jgi:hypothetical protein
LNPFPVSKSRNYLWREGAFMFVVSKVWHRSRKPISPQRQDHCSIWGAC